MPRWDIFISHARADREWARWLESSLEEAGYRVATISELEPGFPIVARLRETIADSSAMICLLSPAYNSSTYAQQEWFEAFLEGPLEGPEILPIRVEEGPVPPLLATRLYLDLVGLDKSEAATKLLWALSLYGKRPPQFPPPPGRTPGPPFDNARTKVFFSYSHKDKVWLDRLLVFLRPLEREGKLDLWDDRRIIPGMKWRHEIDAALSECRIAIPLISSDFLASDFILDEELPKMLQAAESDGVLVMPVILRPSRFLRAGIISEFQSVNPPSSPLSRLRRPQWEQIFAEFADLIEDTIGRKD
jgi:hypothetical protein